MPHRVAAFFRKNSGANSPELESKPPKLPPAHTAIFSHLLEDDGNFNMKMPDIHKRLSFQGLTHSSRSSTKSLSHHPAILETVIESPPLVFYGVAENSTGALLSGQLVLNVHDDPLTIDSFDMKLCLETTKKRPFHAHCQECSHQTTDLTSWSFLQSPTTLQKGEHTFPFSFLLPGNLPVTMKGSLSLIEYALRATVSPRDGDPIKLTRKLNVKRAIYPSETPRHSVRIFPPTNITATCTLPAVVHPIGEANVQMRMDGVIKRDTDKNTAIQWRLKRLTWRLDETQKSLSPGCAKHIAKSGNQEAARRGAPHQEVRTLAMEELKTGWKSDYSGADGTIEIEFPIAMGATSRPVCGVQATPDGTSVGHVLVVEMIVAEEFVSLKKPNQPSPTGAARVLRMHFNVTVTERAGLGISWDEEQPPLYEHVPASPPSYIRADVYDEGPIPDYEDLTPLGIVDGGGSSEDVTTVAARSGITA